jgi:hypothetical protein
MSWMSAPVDELIDAGYTGIAIEEHSSKEESSGYQDETEIWTVVARPASGPPVRLGVYKHTSFAPRGERPVSGAKVNAPSQRGSTPGWSTPTEYPTLLAIAPASSSDERRSGRRTRCVNGRRPSSMHGGQHAPHAPCQ